MAIFIKLALFLTSLSRHTPEYPLALICQAPWRHTLFTEVLSENGHCEDKKKPPAKAKGFPIRRIIAGRRETAPGSHGKTGLPAGF
jgi:hypothetical protein